MTQQLLAVDLISTVGYDGYFKSLKPCLGANAGLHRGRADVTSVIGVPAPDDVKSTMAEHANLLATGADTIYFFNRYPTKAEG